MNKEKCKRKIDPKDRKTIYMKIKVSKAESKFMKDNNYAPSLIFYDALAELGFESKKE